MYLIDGGALVSSVLVPFSADSFYFVVVNSFAYVGVVL